MTHNQFYPALRAGLNRQREFEDPNPAYLDHIEFIIDQAAARGLKTGLVVAWGADFSGSRPGIGEHAPPPWDDWLDHSGLPADRRGGAR